MEPDLENDTISQRHWRKEFISMERVQMEDRGFPKGYQNANKD